MEKLIDTHLSTLLTKQGINKDSVELLHDYAPRSRGKEHSPYAKFYRDLKSGKHIMVTGILPYVTNAGFFIVPQFRAQGNGFISEENCFETEIIGETVRVVCVNDQPNGRKKDDWAEWHPQVYLDGALQNCGNPLWLDTDVINPNYHFNTIQWDFGFCKRRARVIEARFRDRITLTEDPHYEVRVRNNTTGNMRLRYGSRDGEGSPIGRVEGDVEIISKEELANAIYPITIGASPETFYPDAHVETSSVDGESQHKHTEGETWAHLHDATDGTGAWDDTNGMTAQISTHADSGKWKNIQRPIFVIDASGLPDVCNITVAVFTAYGTGEGHGFGGSVNIYSSNPASNTAVGTADFDQLGTTPFCDSAIACASWDTAGDNDFSLNGAGMATISKTVATPFGMRIVADATDSEPGWSETSDYVVSSTADLGGGTVPKLVVTYTTGWAGGDVDGVAIAGIAKINGVALADITKVNGV